MNIEMMRMDKHAALSAYRDYRAAVKIATDERRRGEDALTARAHLAAAKGHSIVDLHAVMRTAGLFDSGYPKLAICRADVERCRVKMFENGSAYFWPDGQSDPQWDRRRRPQVTLPADTFQRSVKRGWNDTAVAMVPSIPPSLRPKHALAGYHILWEAVWEPAPPVDPLLLKHLGGMLYSVLAAWDLTPIERAVLRGRLTQS